MQNTVDEMIDFFLFEKGEDIKINGVLQRALVLDAVNKINQDSDKIIHCKVEIKTGDVIEYMEQKYLITSQIDKNSNSYSAKIKQCNYRIAFNFSGNVKWFDVLIETKVMDIDSNQYMVFPVGKVRVSLQDNFDSRDISLGDRFINTGRAFEVSGIDKANKGLIILTCDLTLKKGTDDISNEIAERWDHEIIHTFILSINNGFAMNAPLNDISQLNIIVTDNGIAMVTLPALTFLSSDQNIVTVDNNGRMMGINSGTATIICQMTYKSTVKATIDITVVENISHSFTIIITGITTIKLGRSQSYVAHFYDNGIEGFDKSAVWTICNQDGTTAVAYATITASTGNGATVEGSNNPSHTGKYVVLRSELSDDPVVFKEFTIQVESIF